MESNKKMQDQINGFILADKTKNRKAELNSIIGGLSTEQKAVYECLDITNMSDENFTELKVRASKSVSDFQRLQQIKGATFGGALGGNDLPKEPTKEEVEKVYNLIKI